jgi:hypothetical protein
MENKNPRSKRKLIFIGMLIGLSALVYFVYTEYFKTLQYEDLPPYESHLAEALEFIETSHDDPELRQQLIRYAKSYDAILKEPKLTDEELQKELSGRSPQAEAIACLMSLDRRRKNSNGMELSDDLELILVGGRANLKRYLYFEKQFYGQVISGAMHIKNYENDCK